MQSRARSRGRSIYIRHSDCYDNNNNNNNITAVCMALYGRTHTRIVMKMMAAACPFTSPPRIYRGNK